MSCHACGGRGYARELLGPNGIVVARADSGFLYCVFCRGDQQQSKKIFVDKVADAPLRITPVEVLQDEFAARRERVLRQISASQVDLYQTCARKWYYSYIEGRREPQSSAQAAGTAIDDEYVQPYLRTGEIKITGPWSEHLRALVPHLPKPSPELLVQHRFEIATFDGGPVWLGFMDWVRQRGESWLQAEDLKSTSDFRYAKTPEQLLRNTQMMSYAEALHREFEPEKVSIAHVVIRRKSPKVLVTPGPDDRPLYVSRQHAADFYGSMLDDVRAMTEAARSCASADDLTPNTEACGDYGGCFHRASCAGLISTTNLTKGFPKMSTPNGTGMTLAERLAARNASPPPPKPGSPFTMQPPAQPFRRPEPVTTAPDAVVPPDAPPRESTPEYVAEVEASAKKPRKPKAAPAATDAALSAAEEDEEAQLEAKLKATREKKAAAAAEAAREADLAKKAAEEAELEKARQALRDSPKAKIAEASKALKTELDAQIPARATRKVPATKPILLVDCLPQKGAVPVALEDWLAPIAEAAAAAYVDPKTGAVGVADWRLISYNSAPILAVAIRAALDTCPEVLTIDSRQRGAEIALEELVPHAALVIRGVR